MRYKVDLHITLENHRKLIAVLRSIPIFIEHTLFDGDGGGTTTHIIGKFAGNLDFTIYGNLAGTDRLDDLYNVLFYGESTFSGQPYFRYENIPLRIADEEAEALITYLKAIEAGSDLGLSDEQIAMVTGLMRANLPGDAEIRDERRQ